MKKINGISLLHGIAILSGIGIVGIFAWCDESINEGGRGITPTLLFVVYVLLLLACNAEIIASDENFKRVFDRTKKVYDIAKNNASVEGINLYNFEHDKKMQNSYFCHVRILTCDFMACNPCTWCYFESDFITEDEYLKSVCFRCDNNFCKFTNAMWKYKRRNHYLQKIGRIKRKLFRVLPMRYRTWNSCLLKSRNYDTRGFRQNKMVGNILQSGN